MALPLPADTLAPKLVWVEFKPEYGWTPEEHLPLKKYKFESKDRRCTPYVLVIREERERVDCAKRVEIDGKWYWTDGDGISRVTHWAAYTRPVEWDQKAHEEKWAELFRKEKK